MTTTQNAEVIALPVGSIQDRLHALAGAVRPDTINQCIGAAVDVLITGGEPEIASRLNQARTLDAVLARTLILSAGLEAIFRTEEARTDEDLPDPMMR